MTDAQGGSLAAAFRRLIANTGPISVMHYMGEANARYYASRDPLGAAKVFREARARFPQARRLLHGELEALLEAGRPAEAFELAALVEWARLTRAMTGDVSGTA